MKISFITVATLFLLVGSFTSTFAAPVVTVSFQDGVNGYTGTQDTKIMSANPTTVNGTTSKLELDGSPDKSSFLYWDLTSISPGSVIQAVDITVNITNRSSQNYEFYQLLQPWVESEATWNQYASGQSWQVAGADGSGDRGSTVLGYITAPSKGLVTIALNSEGVAVVQSWVDNPPSNYGFIIQDYINASNGLDFNSRETGTITNRPKMTVTYDSVSLPVLTIDDVTITEGNEGAVDVIFTISLSFANSDPVTVDYSTADGSATTADNDYIAASGQIHFQPGETSREATVVVIGDTFEEPNETFIVNLSNAANAAIGDNQGIGTILDDDRPLAPDIAANPASHDYGDVAIGTSSSKVFVISNEGTTNLNVYSTSLIGSDAGEFSILNGGGPFMLAPGNVHSINVSFLPVLESLKNAVLELTSDDPDESVFDINLSGNGVTFSLPGESITFSVTGDYPDFGEMEILDQHIIQHNLYSPSEFFAHVGDILDQDDSCQETSYQNVADRLNTLAVPAFVVIGDNDWIDCPDQAQAFQWWFERFTYFEDNFCGSPVVERQGIRPENWAFVMKGVLFVGINNPSTSADGEDRTIRLQDDADWVDFQLLDKAEQIRAAVVFGHGPPSGSESVFFDQFKASSITFTKPVFYIHGHNHEWRLDNPWPDAPNMQRLTVDRGGVEDPAQITVSMDPNYPFQIERWPWTGNPVVFNRGPCVEARSAQMISQFDYFLDGVATDDGVPTNPGSLAITWSKISGPGDVVFGDANALTTIANFTIAGIYELRLTAYDGELASSDALIIEVEDIGSILSINDISIDEGNSGTANAIFNLILSPASNQTVTIDFATADSTATAGSDYVAVSGQVSFQPGETSKPVMVQVNGDVLNEPNETFFVNLSNAVNATIADNQGTGIIIDDDAGNEPPVITLLGANPLIVEFGSTYTDPGATATDDVDGDLSGSIVVGGDTVNTSALGSYTITYDVSDSAGNAAIQVTRTVNVVDTTKPVIILTGANPQVITVGSAYTELGASATDNVDGDISGSIVIDASGVNTAVAGGYTVTYNVIDSSGNVAAEVTRTVTVVDSSAPVITLLGANPLIVEFGSTYTDPGATATDDVDGDLSGSIVVGGDTVNTSALGSYTITYDVSDSAGNTAIQVTRTVNVVDTTKPVIILTGANPQVIPVGTAYTELGASATDNVDGDISGSIVIDASGVNTLALGSYTITYNVSDSAGNAAIQVTRTVNVVDTTQTVSLQDGVSGYTGTRDTKLMSQSPTTNFGTSIDMEIDGSPDRSSLLYWDLTSISPGSVIQSVDITVNITNRSSQNYEFYQLLQPWVESEATWNEYASGQSWQVAGADGSGDRGSTVLGYITAPSKGLVTISLNSVGVAVVQSWVDNPPTNYGFIIQDYINATNGLDFSSRETGTVTNRPKMTITYSTAN